MTLKEFCLVWSACFVVFFIDGVELTISQSGVYQLIGRINASPSVMNDAIIRIETDNVVLDLNDAVLSQGNAVAALIGIELVAGCQNIMIKNGTIKNITGTGILVNQSCRNVTISTITLSGCQTRGITFLGSVGNEIVDSSLQNCRIISCCSGGSGDRGISLDFCQRLVMRNCIVNSSGNAANSFVGIRLNSSRECDFNIVSVNQNVGSNSTCYNLINVTSSIFKKCVGRDHSPGTGFFRGFNLSATSTFNMFKECIIMQAAALTDAVAFNLEDSSQNNFFNGCTALAMNAGSSYADGFACNGSSANIFQNAFIDCISQLHNTVGNGQRANGFKLEGSDYGLLLGCIGSYQTSTNLQAEGILISRTGSDSNDQWLIKDNLVARNFGINELRSTGIRITGGGHSLTNLLLSNVAFNNNTQASRQFYSVPVNSQVSAAGLTNNLNGVSFPWTNIGVAS